MAATIKSKMASKLLGILERRYGKKPRPPGWNSIETLLFYIIYYSSGVTAARRAFKELREEYADLNEVRVSSLSEIRGTLLRAGADENVAYQLRSVLKQIFVLENEVSLALLGSLTPDEVRRYLSRLDHLPRHAIEYLLLVRRNHPVLPVDKQVARMVSRIGLVPANAGVEQVQRILMRNVKVNSYFDFYTLSLEHVSKVCTARARCDRCVLIKHCKRGKAASGKKSK